MLKLVDDSEAFKFIPSCEQDSENPTIFHIRPETMRDQIRREHLFKIIKGIGQVEFADDDRWLEYMAGRIIKIDNAPSNESPLILFEKLGGQVGREMFSFMMDHLAMTDEQVKN
jgi:hypothetical protein